jgi:hypothetical protein
MMAAVMRPQIKSPFMPKLVPVKGAKKGEQKPVMDPSTMIKINPLFAFCRRSFNSRVAVSTAVVCPSNSRFCFLMK